ncbi:h-sco1 [Cantharellus anzutake]|uniref:h-sco1 n=1 Tax=Cantharellus anzutake TaxID=1750568 RepID=UPI0019064168|nr:h-sco1 [Cantharellus anzutake]KAF8334994.1 h-sco1 [Cantharellus anzutake]
MVFVSSSFSIARRSLLRHRVLQRQGIHGAHGLRQFHGPFTWKAAALFIATGGGLWYYFTTEKAKMLEKRQQELATASYGKAKIGGPFSLITHEGKRCTEKDLMGHWSLLYFGFTNCPDICPDELDKMGSVVDSLDREFGKIVQPVFISCDPRRDTVQRTAAYVKDFHPRLIGLTGDYEAVKATCKAFRVYFSTPPDTKPGDDYLVDHSIFFYLMNPAGEFVDAYGKSQTAETIRSKVAEAISQWQTSRA